MRAILLDLDGVLIDSWQVVEQSVVAAAAELDLNCQERLADFRARMGMPLEDIAAELAFPAEFVVRFRNAARLRDGQVRPFDGVVPMLAHMRDFGLRIGVVTGKYRPRTLSILETAGLAKFVDAVVTADDAPGKPRPDGLWLCERLLGTGPALGFVGDTAIDVQAAENAARMSILATWGSGPSLPSRTGVIEVVNPSDVMGVIAALAQRAM
jgi:phosphoglycolate phosphatase-like HAD superfamily hydrolase